MTHSSTFSTPNERAYSLGEEIANSVTHGLGALLAAASAALLVAKAAAKADALAVVAFALFGASLVLLFTASTVYHAVRAPRAKRRLEVLDHASIYALIAGTYTPFCLTALRGPLGWSLFAAVWGLAAAGIVFKIFFIDRFRLLSTLGYVLMGWLVVVALGPLKAALSGVSVALLVAGGILYTAGAAFYAMKRVPWFHPVWHVFVLGGAACHVLAALAIL